MEFEYSCHREHTVNLTFGKWKLSIFRYLAGHPIGQAKQGIVL